MSVEEENTACNNSTTSPVTCIICGKANNDDEKLTKLLKKGIRTLLDFSKRKDDFSLEILLKDDCEKYVHHSCRREYTDKRSLSCNNDENIDPNSKKLRSSLPLFDWNTSCLFCGELACVDTKHPDRNPVWMVRTLEVKSSLLGKCESGNRPWSDDVRARLLNCSDLVSPNARYHRRCYLMFNRSPGTLSCSVVSGRPTDDDMYGHFLALCEWLEVDSELHTISELHEKLAELAGGDTNCYSDRYLREKLKERYGDHVFFAKIGGQRKDVVCFADMAGFIVNDKWYQDRNSNKLLETERIMRTAARLIREEVRGRNYTKSEYPNPDDYKDVSKCQDFLTHSLRVFLKTLFGGENLKSAAIGHAVTQLTRPRSVISPLLFGLGVELDHVFGSRWLIEELYSLGFSVSYDEITTLKHSLLQQTSLDEFSSPSSQPVQFVADNADSNIATLDGSGTFHGLGIIRAIKHRNNAKQTVKVKRLARIKMSELAGDRSIPVLDYLHKGPAALSSHKFTPYRELQFPVVIPPRLYYSNLLWSVHTLRKPTKASTDFLNWSGYMTHIFRGYDTIDEDDVTILPLIDLDPNDYTTLYSCLVFISNEVKKLNLSEASITLDQPLFLKCQEIVLHENIHDVVVRIGGFHLVMSAVGSIFGIMKGSGLEDALNCIYGSNTISHMMTGKAISRALRALHLMDAALSSKLLELMPSALTTNNQNLMEVLENVSGDDCGALDAAISLPDLRQLENELNDLKCKLKSKSRTAKLWLQFQEHAHLLNYFLACERLKYWDGHLNAITSLLSLFAAKGHLHYAKSARLYVQEMRRLPHTHPTLHRLYTEQGMHVIQRTGHPFNGLSPDLVIEQALMRALKIRGGLTHGRGLTESVRLQWVYTMPFFVAAHNAMTSLTGRRYTTSEQHVDSSSARRDRDMTDLNKLMAWLNANDPFDEEVIVLKSLSTGLTAERGDGINCDEAATVGSEIQKSLDNVSVSEAKIKRRSTVRTLADLKPAVKIGAKSFNVDADVLFLRCTAVAQRLEEEVEPFFSYELTVTPAALFKDFHMRHANKADLADTLLRNVNSESVQEDVTQEFTIIDGGWLLNLMQWRKGTSFVTVLQKYVDYMKKFSAPVVVFDGYMSSTKDHEHSRRQLSVKKRSNTIDVKPENILHCDQSEFLANKQNKISFIDMLACSLDAAQIPVSRCDADADTTVVSMAINYARNGQSVTVVANDTDILVMLIYHWRQGMADIKLRRQTGKRKNHIYSIQKVCDSIGMIQSHILFIHAWSGCDTTSACFGHGKNSFMKLVTANERVRILSEIISNTTSTVDEIRKAGVEIFSLMFGYTGDGGLTRLRYIKFKQMMSDKNSIDVCRLPPTEKAAIFHTMRVHLQIIVWQSLDEQVLNPVNWGWKRGEDGYSPITTDMPPAPESILKFVRCKCKAAKNQCGGNQCSCRKNGIKCVDVCGGCHGVGCGNADSIDMSDD